MSWCKSSSFVAIDSTPAVSLMTASRLSDVRLVYPLTLIPAMPSDAPTTAAKISITGQESAVPVQLF
jgi:hypothetical protein